MSRRKVAELDTPFSTVEWPPISQEDQDTILELLCTLLAPLGQHRRDHGTPSRGKRSRRRLRAKQGGDGLAAGADAGAGSDAPSGAARPAVSGVPRDVPPPPALAAHVDIGLASITRALARSTAAPQPPAEGAGAAAGPAPPAPAYTAIFVVRSGHPSVFYAHFPQMVAVASGASPADAIRLVGFSRSCEERLSACLGVPRVSSIALRAGAAQSQGLVDFLRERVPPVEVRWLDEARSGEYCETRIHMADVKVGPKKKKA